MHRNSPPGLLSKTIRHLICKLIKCSVQIKWQTRKCSSQIYRQGKKSYAVSLELSSTFICTYTNFSELLEEQAHGVTTHPQNRWHTISEVSILNEEQRKRTKSCKMHRASTVTKY